ncbi:MAG: hypothetical protein ACI4E4_11365 [Acetatifactor sp.]
MSREYKSDVFSMLMENKTYALEVYNSLNDTDYTDPEAVETAIDECIREHILEDFFLARKDEVMKMTHLDYTWEKREKMIRKEEYEDGVKDGEARGEERSRSEIVGTMLAAGIDVSIILKSGFTMEEIEKAGGQK